MFRYTQVTSFEPLKSYLLLYFNGYDENQKMIDVQYKDIKSRHGYKCGYRYTYIYSCMYTCLYIFTYGKTYVNMCINLNIPHITKIPDEFVIS